MKKRDTQWRVAENNEMTDQEVGSLLWQGWEAARKGEPLDHGQPFHWVSGYRLYCATHRPHDPLAANH